jgi:hypothetical protein
MGLWWQSQISASPSVGQGQAGFCSMK